MILIDYLPSKRLIIFNWKERLYSLRRVNLDIEPLLVSVDGNTRLRFQLLYLQTYTQIFYLLDFSIVFTLPGIILIIFCLFDCGI